MQGQWIHLQFILFFRHCRFTYRDVGDYTDFEGSDQYKWVEVGLGKVDRTITPWVVVVVVHVPWYYTNSAHKSEGESMRKAMEELLHKARVDVVFVGHVHAYERCVSHFFFYFFCLFKCHFKKVLIKMLTLFFNIYIFYQFNFYYFFV